MLNQQENATINRLTGEFNSLLRSPNTNYGITVGLPDKNDMFHWRATLAGPKDSSYSGGTFILTISFPKNYPNSAPEVCFKTPIYHVNVNPKQLPNNGEKLGHVCISTLNWWKPEYKMRELLTNIFALFYMGNPDSPYGLDRADELRNNRAIYEEKIKYFTKKYANPMSTGKNLNRDQDWNFNYP